MPDAPCSSSIPRAQRPSLGAVERALKHIQDNFCDRLPLEDLAAVAQLSVFRFATVFRRRVGVPPHRYICQLRVQRAQALLREGVPAAIVANEAGFFDQSHLSKHFRSVCGMTPRQYLSQVRKCTGHGTTRSAAASRGFEEHA